MIGMIGIDSVSFSHSLSLSRLLIRATESNKMAEANDFKNRKLREAFGLGEFNQEDRKKAEEAERRNEIQMAKEIRQKKYQ